MAIVIPPAVLNGLEQAGIGVLATGPLTQLLEMLGLVPKPATSTTPAPTTTTNPATTSMSMAAFMALSPDAQKIVAAMAAGTGGIHLTIP